MSKTPIDIRPVIQELWGGRQPNSNFEGLYHHLEFDWSIFDTDFDSFIEKLRVLHEFITPRCCDECIFAVNLSCS